MLQSLKAAFSVATSKHVDASFGDIEAKHIVELCGALAFKAASDDKGDQVHSIYKFQFCQESHTRVKSGC